MPSSHSLDAIAVTFDDGRLVANAGLLAPATLAQHLGLRELFEANVNLGDAPGRANVGHKAMTVIHAMLAGADSIDDSDVLRAGATQSVLGHTVLGHTVLAPSTIGTFLRSFTWGHCRQLDRSMWIRVFARPTGWPNRMGPSSPTTMCAGTTRCSR